MQEAVVVVDAKEITCDGCKTESKKSVRMGPMDDASPSGFCATLGWDQWTMPRLRVFVQHFSKNGTVLKTSMNKATLI
jgi:hypothetical protein